MRKASTPPENCAINAAPLHSVTAGSDRASCAACGARMRGLCGIYPAGVEPIVARYRCGERRIQAGANLFSQGQICGDVFNIVEGMIFLYILLRDGRRQILQFCLPGDLLGLPADEDAAVTYSYSAQALMDTVVDVIPRKAIRALIEEDAKAGEHLACMAECSCRLCFDHLASLGQQSARERVAHLLLELFTRLRARRPGYRGEEIYLPLTQEHIGDATGLTNVHVCRVLQDLRADGTIAFHYGQLRILDPDRLDRLADISATNRELMKSWIGG